MQTSKATFASERRPVPLLRLPTPLLTVDLDALEHNVDTMAAWCRAAGVDLAPHGKTTMSPDIWRRQLDAGAWGITVATAFQAAVAREAGVRVVLAGPVQPGQEAYFAEQVEPALGDGVEYVGEADAERKRALYRRARALLMPIRWPEPFGLVMIDLDEFKAVNDALGHQAGDLLLSQIASAIVGKLTDSIEAVGKKG